MATISSIKLEAGKAYIQKNPLFGRKVIRFDRIRESVWDWELCDATLVTIDKEPSIVHLRNSASSIYDHQGLEEIPERVFRKVENLVKLFEATTRIADDQQTIVLRQETLGKIVELLTECGIIDESTYDTEHLRRYSEAYDNYSREQMEHVTDVIDVHK